MTGVFIGTSGWTYKSWSGTIYPKNVPDRERLEYFARELFSTVELNASYYRWPGLSTFQGWHRRLPRGFRMTVKAPKGLTHVNKLEGSREWIERITPCLEALGDRLGLFLVQLPPSMQRDDAVLTEFLEAWPKKFAMAIEFRHDSWLDDAVFALLQKHDVAYVVMDGPKMTTSVHTPASNVYLRFHGPKGAKLYGGSYTDDVLNEWAQHVAEWQHEGRNIWVYFNNDMDGAAVENARTLQKFVDEKLK